MDFDLYIPDLSSRVLWLDTMEDPYNTSCDNLGLAFNITSTQSYPVTDQRQGGRA